METLWCLRHRGSDFDPVPIYGDVENIFSLRINHGGVLIQHPVRRYVYGKVDYVDMVDAKKFSILELDYMIQEIGYSKDEIIFYYFLIPETDFSTGLRPLGNDQDTLLMLDYVSRFKIIELFTEHSLKPLALEWVNQESVDNHDNMDAIKKQDLGLHKWLMDIPPKHWAIAHFSGRSKCDVLLNNLCEVFNKQLVGGRDKPIISCLEYIREYMMRRISVVNKLINKCPGPLTPTATKTFNQIKEKASQYVVQFNGQHKYQVSGPWNDQFVVNMETRTCSCRKWELIGIPCKHAVAVNWDMIRNGLKVGLPESWVNEVYWLDTWKKVYQHTVDPINCRDMWKPSSCPTSLLPPKHHVQVGRLKKARRKSAEELSQRIGKMTRLGGTVTCGNCKNKGHNKRNCKGQGGDKELEK